MVSFFFHRSNKLKTFYQSVSDTIPILENLSAALLHSEYENALERALALSTCPVVPFFGAFLRELRDVVALNSKVRKQSSNDFLLLISNCLFTKEINCKYVRKIQCLFLCFYIEFLISQNLRTVGPFLDNSYMENGTFVETNLVVDFFKLNFLLWKIRNLFNFWFSI